MTRLLRIGRPATFRLRIGRSAAFGLRIGRSAAFAAGLAMTAAAAVAQPAGQPAAQPPPVTYGPPIPGVCILDGVAAMRASQAGIGAFQQLNQFRQTAQTELNGVSQSIAADDKALTAQKATLPPADYDKKAAAIRARRAALDRDTRARNAQLEQTREQASVALARLVNVAANEVVTARRCSLLLDRKSIIGGSPGMDITDATVQQLNTTTPSVTLNLAPKPAAPAAAPAANRPPAVTPRPAAPAH